MNMKRYYVITGKAIRGKWKDQYVVVGSLKENTLAETTEQAQEFLDRAAKYISSRKMPEIDINTLQISEVGVKVDSMPVSRIDL